MANGRPRGYEPPLAQTLIKTSESFKTVARLFLQSPWFKFFYLINGLGSIVCLILSFLYTCPPPYFYTLEILINLGMIVEVLARFLALGKVRLFLCLFIRLITHCDRYSTINRGNSGKFFGIGSTWDSLSSVS